MLMVHAVAAASLSMSRPMAFVRSSLAGEMTRTATNFVMSNTSPVSPLALLLLCGNLRAEEVGVAPRASLDCFLLGRGLLGKERDSRCDRGKYVGYIRSAATLVARCPPFRSTLQRFVCPAGFSGLVPFEATKEPILHNPSANGQQRFVVGIGG